MSYAADLPRTATVTRSQVVAPTRPGAAQSDPAVEHRRLPLPALLVVLTGAFLAMTDFFVVNVALADIGRDLHATTAGLELVVSGYGATYAALLVIGGRLGDAYGRRRLFWLGLVAFTVTSLLCGLAPSEDALIGARVLQGAAAAAMVPQVFATIQASTSGPHRVRALAIFGATGGIAAVAGQVLGGLLVSADIAGTGWRPIFLVNVPVGVLAMVLVPRVVPDSRAIAPAPVDWAGTLLLATGLVALLVPLSEGRALGWPAWSLALLALVPFVAAALVAVEARLERRGGVPLVPPTLLRIPSMNRGLTLALPFFAAFGGFMFVYAVATQVLLGWSALRAGLTLAPMAGAFLVSSLLTSRLLARYGRNVMTAGLLVMAVGYVSLAVTVWLRWPDGLDAGWLLPSLAVSGFGQGLAMSPLIGLVLAHVPLDSAGVGGGVLATTQQTALALGATGVGTLFASLATSHVGAGPLVVVLAIVVAVALGGAAFSRLLPDLR